jgi:Ca-activated chloride channel homolog
VVRSAKRKWYAGLAVLLLLSLVAVVARYSAASPTPSRTLRVLASGDLGNMSKILTQEETRPGGVRVRLTITSPVNAAQEVANGDARSFDAVWFASDAYFDLFPAATKDLKATTPIMSSPVVLAVRSSVARSLGWGDGSATWAQIAAAAEAGRFTFGMASPATADAGLSGLIAAAIATAADHGILPQSQLSSPKPELSGLFHGQRLSAPDSAALINDYLAQLKDPGPGLLGGVIDYESDLLTLKSEAPANEPLTLVYPSDGVIEANYPLSVLSTAPAAARAAFQLLVSYLTSPAVQRQIMTTTHRRPVYLTQPPSGLRAIPDVLRPPGSPAAVKTLIQVYLAQLRTPGHTVYVLDTSGSMSGAGLIQLERAVSTLTTAGAGLAGQFSKFQSREEVTLLPFSDGPGTPATFTIPGSDPGPVLADIRRHLAQLRAGGATDIYGALEKAYQILDALDAKAPGIDSIVLITDGKNHSTLTLSDFLASYRSLAARGKAAPVYPVAVGQADLTALGMVASATGGILVDAEQQPLSALDAIVEAIRGYQ